MPIRNRLAAIALGLVLSSASALAQDPPQHAPQSEPEAAGNQGETSTTSDSATTPELSYAQRFLTAIERLEPAIRELIAEEDKVAAQEERDRNNNDLRAQEKMAVWAFWMFVATAVSVVATFVGLALIRQTLLYTRDAAVHAGRAVDEAQNATKAAQDAVTVTRDIGQQQLRAYLYIDRIAVKLSSDESGDWFVFDTEVVLRNGGVTPADLKEITISTGLSEKLSGGRRNNSPTEIGPGGTFEFDSRGSLKEKDFRNDSGVLYGTWFVAVDYSYSDYLERVWERVVEYKGLVKIRPETKFPVDVKLIRFSRPKPDAGET